jgi:hypothetical protein
MPVSLSRFADWQVTKRERENDREKDRGELRKNVNAVAKVSDLNPKLISAQLLCLCHVVHNSCSPHTQLA